MVMALMIGDVLVGFLEEFDIISLRIFYVYLVMFNNF